MFDDITSANDAKITCLLKIIFQTQLTDGTVVGSPVEQTIQLLFEKLFAANQPDDSENLSVQRNSSNLSLRV